MKKAFTIIEVSILFVIFLIVAFLVAPFSLDETMKVNNSAKWRERQADFANIADSIVVQKDNENFNYENVFKNVISGETKKTVKPYKIAYMNGTYPETDNKYRFSDYKLTQSDAVVSYKFLQEQDSNIKGILMYDVNGSIGPNVWGKDVFGLNIYEDRFEPFCKNDDIKIQEKDCSKIGTGLCCSNWRLIGGSID